MLMRSNTDDIVVALGQSDRINHVELWNLKNRHLNKVLAAMQVPFPELTGLRLISHGKTPPVPDSFLGGSAPPHLQIFELSGIPFPGLARHLLSATHLVTLELPNIPHSGYVSPEAMSALLSVVSSPEKLILQFESHRSRPDLESRRPPPLKRSVIPALTDFWFQGVIEYLEDLVTDIEAPQLNRMYIRFFRQINVDRPELAQFISRLPSLGDRGVAVEFI